MRALLVVWMAVGVAAGCHCPAGNVGDPCMTNRDCEVGYCDPRIGTCSLPELPSDGSPGTTTDATTFDSMTGNDSGDVPTDSGGGSDSAISVVVVPSNGLVPSLADPGGPALVFVTSGSIDTDTCTVIADGSLVGVGTATLTPGGGAPDICVLLPSAVDINAGATVLVTGGNGLAIFSATEIDVAGTLDGSAVFLAPGAGGDSGGMADQAGSGMGGGSTGATGDSGGGGGGFCGTGGPGGDGNGTGGPGGSPYGNATLTPLFGGSGGGGGADSSGVQGGTGGAGGGALHLAALGSIFVRSTGTIHVGGGGGMEGQTDMTAYEAGGGGGSGGGLLIEAVFVEVEAGGVLAANGGGGGGQGMTGNGQDAWASALTAIGGGVDGGDGSTVTNASGSPGLSGNGNGGGGGGAAGRIRINTYMDMPSVAGAAISPDGSTGCFTTGPVAVQ